jgi:hypothetical protein
MAENIAYLLAIALKNMFETSPDFPFDKSPNRKNRREKPRAIDAALKENSITPLDRVGSYHFQIGNKNAERYAPHYHILEDAQTIRMPNRGTKKTLGSQAGKTKGKRDYSVYNPPEPKTNRLTQEYRTSYTSGRRSYVPTTLRLIDLRSKVQESNRKLPYRYNKHFAYIERIIEINIKAVAGSLDLEVVNEKGNMQQLYQDQNGQITSTPPFNPSTGEILGG